MGPFEDAGAQEADVYLGELTWILEQIGSIVASYPPGLLGWRPGTGTANSASAIANHVSKSTRVYALGFGCGQPVERDREAEFRAADADVGTLMEEIRTLVTDLKRALVAVTREPREISAREAIVESIRHAAIHLGELRLTRDLAERESRQ